MPGKPPMVSSHAPSRGASLADRGNSIGESTAGCSDSSSASSSASAGSSAKAKPSGGGAVAPVSEDDCPQSAPIKGNQSGLYHVPGRTTRTSGQDGPRTNKVMTSLPAYMAALMQRGRHTWDTNSSCENAVICSKNSPYFSGREKVPPSRSRCSGETATADFRESPSHARPTRRQDRFYRLQVGGSKLGQCPEERFAR
jgi:hypothetical protein